MRLRYTRPALADLDAILDYIATHLPRGAAHIHARIDTVLQLLLRHPNIGARTEDPAIRRVAATPIPI